MNRKFQWLGYTVEDILFLVSMYSYVVLDGDRQLVVTGGQNGQ